MIKEKRIVVYSASYPFSIRYELHTADALHRYLSKIDPMAPHMPLEYKSGLPTFRLGTKLYGQIDGERFISEPTFSKTFLFAYSVTVDAKGRIIADVPTDDAYVSDDGLVRRHCQNMIIHPTRQKINAIIEPRTLKQLWPTCVCKNASVMQHFLSESAHKNSIKKR